MLIRWRNGDAGSTSRWTKFARRASMKHSAGCGIIIRHTAKVHSSSATFSDVQLILTKNSHSAILFGEPWTHSHGGEALAVP